MNRRDVFALLLVPLLPLLPVQSRRQVEVRIGSLVGWDDHVNRQLIAAIREAVDGKDVILFNRDSRQARLLTETMRDAD